MGKIYCSSIKSIKSSYFFIGLMGKLHLSCAFAIHKPCIRSGCYINTWTYSILPYQLAELYIYDLTAPLIIKLVSMKDLCFLVIWIKFRFVELWSQPSNSNHFSFLSGQFFFFNLSKLDVSFIRFESQE